MGTGMLAFVWFLYLGYWLLIKNYYENNITQGYTKIRKEI